MPRLTINSRIGSKMLCALGLVLALACVAVPVQAQTPTGWYVDGFAGAMTENRWHDVFDPSRASFAGSYLLGGGIGWERQIGKSRFRYGVQLQGVGHFGSQDHFEINLPVVLRYVPRAPRPKWFNSAAFGLGVSHATKVPRVEIDRSGASQRNFAYWFAEIETRHARRDTTLFFRLHHRSDAYGLFEENSGSTAVVLGWRRAR